MLGISIRAQHSTNQQSNEAGRLPRISLQVRDVNGNSGFVDRSASLDSDSRQYGLHRIPESESLRSHLDNIRIAPEYPVNHFFLLHLTTISVRMTYWLLERTQVCQQCTLIVNIDSPRRLCYVDKLLRASAVFGEGVWLFLASCDKDPVARMDPAWDCRAEPHHSFLLPATVSNHLRWLPFRQHLSVVVGSRRTGRNLAFERYLWSRASDQCHQWVAYSLPRIYTP